MPLPLVMLICILSSALQAQCWKAYDSTAYSKCYSNPRRLLYAGGILINPNFDDGLRGWSANGNCVLQRRNSSSSFPRDLEKKLDKSRNLEEKLDRLRNLERKLYQAEEEEEEEEEEGSTNWFVVAANRTAVYNGPSQLLPNLTATLKYSLSAWLQVSGPVQHVLIKATLAVDGGKHYVCVGTVIAQRGCWSFLKGGFSLDGLITSSTSARLYFETMNFSSGTDLWLDRAAVQPFSDVEWKSHQAAQKELLRQRIVSLQVVDSDTGRRIHDADIQVMNAKLNFPFGSAILQNILNNQAYQAAIYLEDILQEAFSHPAVNGIVMWTAWEPKGCYRMCLTDNNMANLATGDVVDALLQEWEQVEILTHTGGASKWRGPIGAHNVSIHWHNNTYYTSLLVHPGKGVQHFVMEIPTTSSIVQTQEPSISSAIA
ncbi:hypothetical protein L7F22_039630 [Adiantum nelumboides]|nr:hypothetical protein [Adiantum nelumboides]